MKRRELLAYLRQCGCVLLREGSKHSVYHNPSTHLTSTVPRHSEIQEFLAMKICRDLGIPAPV